MDPLDPEVVAARLMREPLNDDGEAARRKDALRRFERHELERQRLRQQATGEQARDSEQDPTT